MDLKFTSFLSEIEPFEEIELGKIQSQQRVKAILDREILVPSPRDAFFKRCFDIVVASLLLGLVGIWLFPIIAVLIRLDSKGNPFFKQVRKGLFEKDFFCFKFRTMYLNNDESYRATDPNDNRITKIGNFLRRTNLDELPQIINVFLGDMSIVGPRPLAIEECNKYETYIPNFSERYLIKPGITGLAQIGGWRGNSPDFEENRKRIIKRIECDIAYIQNCSFLLDMKIILVTARNMIIGDENAF